MNNLCKRIFGLLTASVIAFEVPNIEAVKIFAQSEPTGYTAEGLPEVYLPKDMEGNDEKAYILPEMEKYIGDNVFNEEKDVNSEADLKAETDEEALSLSDAEDSNTELFATLDSIVNAGNAAVSTSGSYTWSATTVNGMTVAKPGNSGVNSSTSTMTVKTSGGSGVLAFACYVSSESGYDKLIVKRDGTTIHTLSGVKDWQKLTVDVSTSTSAVTFEYSKDSSQHSNEDICYIADVSYCRNVSESDFTFDSSSGEITKYKGRGGAIVIPSTIGGVAVKKIGKGAIEGFTSITSVVIPNGVTSIDNNAFYNCKSLTGVTIPGSVTTIGSYAFEYCSGLTGVTIPGSVTTIGSYAFAYCSGLTSVTIPGSVTTIGEDAFYKCTGLTSVTIPSSVATIGYAAFSYCSGLTSVTIPSSVTSVGNGVFAYCSNLTAINVNENNRYYKSIDGVLFTKDEKTIHSYPAGKQGIYSIPSGVTSIGSYAFEDCTGLTSVTIPNSVTTIGISAFASCESLTSVTIPSSVTTIGGAAFEDCTGLTSVTIPSRVTSIGNYTFEDCTGLTSVTIPNSVTYIGHCAFGGCSGLTSVTIPNSVTYIGNYAFGGCSGLTSVTIPSGVTFIGVRVFGSCSKLTAINVDAGNNDYKSIDGVLFTKDEKTIHSYPAGKQGTYSIPSSVTSIGYEAFEGCTGLTSITIPSSVTRIDSYAFSGISSSAKIYCEKGSTADNASLYPAGVTLVYINPAEDDYTFDSSTGTITGYKGSGGAIVIPSTIGGVAVKSIGEKAFKKCESITSAVIPSGVNTIGWHAFESCTGLVSITIPDSVTSIGYCAFEGCTGLTSVSIPSSVTSISSSAFEGCKGLTSMTIPSSVTSIGDLAFAHCDNLTAINVDENNKYYKSVDGVLFTISGKTIHSYPGGKKGPYVIPDGVATVAGYAFRGCSGLTSVTIPNSVTEIGYWAFEGCTSLTSVNIPDSVTSVGMYAFCRCDNLTSINISSSVTSIDEKVFGECKSLTSVTIPNNVTTIGKGAFYDCVGLLNVTIPNSVESIGESAFNCTGLTSVVIPNSVTTIGEIAFYDCTGLTSVTIPSSVTSIGNDAIRYISSSAKIYCVKGSTADNASLYPSGVTLVYINPAEADYTFDSSTGTITGYKGSGGAVEIPSTIGGVTVKKIEKDAFKNGTAITSIAIPGSVTSIDYGAFADCKNLTAINVDENNSYYKAVNGVLFTKDEKSLHSCPAGKQGSYEIPEEVTAICDNAFYNCTGLTDVKLHTSIITSMVSDDIWYNGNITSIGNYAFYNCTGLTGIIIPKGAVNIGNCAFMNCEAATNLVIADNATTIAYSAFRGCKSLTSVVIPKAVTTIGSYAFSDCTALKSVTMSDNVTSIGSYAFKNCTGLTSIDLPRGVKSIYSGAFYNCTGLTRAVIPGNVTSIGTDAFGNINGSAKIYCVKGSTADNTSLYPAGATIVYTDPTEVDYIFDSSTGTITGYKGSGGNIKIPSTIGGIAVNKIGNKAFYSCESLTGVTISDGITDIGDRAFLDCKNITYVNMPDSVTSIRWYAFDSCEALKSLTISNSVKYISRCTFSGCKALTSVKLPDGLESIAAYGFGSCDSLTSITIPNSVKSIEFMAFAGCDSLSGINVAANNNNFKSIDGVLFTKDEKAVCIYPEGKSGTSYSIPDGVTTIRSCAFNGCTALTSITIPGSVTSVADSSFEGINSSAVIYCVKGSTADNASLYPAGATISYTNTYLIEYDLNGGSGTIANQTKKYGETVTISSTIPTKDGYKFMGWSTSAGGSVAYSAGATYSANANLKLYAVWEENVKQTVPKVKILAATNITAKSATLNATIESNGNAAITSRKFVYYEKNNTGSKYDIDANESFAAKIDNLKPDTEYWFYAYAGSNAAGYGSSVTQSFRTKPEDNEVPVSIEIMPSSQNIKLGTSVNLTTRILPVGTKNKNIVWTSSDESKVTVDAKGRITAVEETDKPVIITATTEVNRLKATCSVTVSDDKVIRDFSEWNMYANTRSKAKHGNNVDFSAGGNIQFATAYLTRWNGPVLESQDPYPKGSGIDTLNELKAGYHSQDVLFIPNRTSDLDNNNIKNAIVKYGGVASAMKYIVEYYSPQSAGYYLPDSVKGGDHQVVIVGWDDNYSRYKFNGYNGYPAGDGAFICKNSSGTGFGEEGYFYISYYDRYIGRKGSKGSIGNAVYLPTESVNNYNKKYEHDPLGPTASVRLEGTESAYIANVFPDGNGVLPGNEVLSAVSFYTYYMGTSYDIYVVKDYESVTSLQKLSNPVKSGIQEYAGYHTVKIPPVELKAGSKFAVVVKLSKPENPVRTYAERPDEIFANATANSGESYYSVSGSEWKDLTTKLENANFCIKAFTRTKDGVYGPKIVDASKEQKVKESDKIYTLEEAMERGFEFSEEYINYINRLELFSESEGSEDIPNSIEIGEADVDYLDGACYPTRYDLRDYGYVSSVKDQGGYNSCWAFAAIGSLESATIKKIRNNQNGSGLDGASEDELLGDVNVQSIIFKDMSLIMPVGETKHLSYEITPLNATNKNVVWESSNSNVVSVDTGGNILAKARGNVSITATTVDGNKVAHCTISVMAGEPVTSVQLTKEAITCKVGKVMLLYYVISPGNASNKNVSWSSDNPQVAQIDENGKLTAVAPGVANITVTTQDGNKTAVCKVTVDDNFDCTIKETSNTISPHGDYMFGTVSAEINNKKSDTLNGTLIFVAYAKDGSVIYSKTKDLSLPSGVSQVSVSDIVISSGTEADSYKLMLWYKGESMKPMANYCEGRFN